MPLFTPTNIRQISAIKGHPYYNEEAFSGELVILLNGEQVKHRVAVADAINGYVKCYKLEADGSAMFEPWAGRSRAKTFRLKGKVQIYTRKATNDVADTERKP